MQITKEQLDSFTELYFNTFAVRLTRKQALDKATSLLTLMAAVHQPVRRSTYERIKQECHDNYKESYARGNDKKR